MTIEEKIKGLTLKAERIPKRTGNNSDWNNAIHWKLTINDSLETEYSEGIGHFINSHHYLNNKLMSEQVINKIKSGEELTRLDFCAFCTNRDMELFTSRINKTLSGVEIKPPKIKDILYSLTIDSDAINYQFDEWCENYGYSNDSLKAKELFELCRDTATKLIQLGFKLDELQEYFQDY